MIKSIFKLSIATVLLLGATVVAMEDTDSVPALVDAGATHQAKLTPLTVPSDVPADLASSVTGIQTTPLPGATDSLDGTTERPSGVPSFSAGNSTNTSARQRDISSEVAEMLSHIFRGTSAGFPSRGVMLSIPSSLAPLFGISTDNPFMGLNRTASSAASFTGCGNPACTNCPGITSGRTTAFFAKQAASLEAELAALTETKAQTTIAIDSVTAELKALNADADQTSLTTVLAELQASRTKSQTAIDAIFNKQTALGAAKQSWEAKEAAKATENARRAAAEEAEAARREALYTAMQQMFIAQLTSKVTPKVKNTKQLFLRRDSSLVSLSFAA